MSFPPRVVHPGADLTRELTDLTKDVRIGDGLAVSPAGDTIHATKAGILCQRVGDVVVGVVSDRNAEHYKLQLHSTTFATLPLLAFDGATKRNKPNISIGGVVFARISAVTKHMDPELSCQAGGAGPKKDWMTGESIFGELKGGTVIQVSCNLARRLFNPSCAVLASFGAAVPFEIAVGLNGMVWIRAGSVTHTVAVSTAISRSETLTDEQCKAMVRQVVDSLKAL